MPPANVELAQRILRTIKDRKNPAQADALALRIWAGPDNGLRPLAEIAKGIVERRFENMKPSDSLPTPLDQKPATHLTELSRKPAGEGFQIVTYRDDDGHRYEASVKDNIIAVQWRRLPSDEA